MNRDTMEYQIHGEEMQLIEIILKKDQQIVAESGSMTHMDSGIKFDSKMSDGSNPDSGFFSNMLSAGKRILGGESAFLAHFKNEDDRLRSISFSSPHPGKIIPIDLAEYNGSIVCQKDSFLCASYGTKVDIQFNDNLSTGLFGGEGFVMQKLTGNNLAFIHAGGTVIKKELNDDSLLLDTGCLVAMTDGINIKAETSGSIKNMVFGGEGAFLAKLSGTGTVWIQSMPFSRLSEKIISKASQKLNLSN